MSELKYLLELIYFLRKNRHPQSLDQESINMLVRFNNWYRAKMGYSAIYIINDKASEKDISNCLIIEYLLENVNNDYFKLKELLCKYHQIMHTYITDLLLDNSLYVNTDETFRYHCANILGECMMKNYACYYHNNWINIIKEYPLYKYLDFPDSLEVSLIITNLSANLYNIYKIKSAIINSLSKYSNSKLHPITIQQIHDLIFQLLSISGYIADNVVDLYKVLMSFNVLNKEEIQSIKDKEAKLVMKHLF